MTTAADRDGDARPPAPGGADGAPAGPNEALKDAVNQSLEEARMVLPGIQALLGFQLVAVFNQRFDGAPDRPQQLLHLTALLLVALSAGLLMTPAAYHRQACRGGVTKELLRVASVSISAGLIPLMCGLRLDMYLVALLIGGSEPLARGLAGLLFAVLAGLWFVIPLSRRWRQAGRG